MYIRSALLLTAAVLLLTGCDQKDHANINIEDKDGDVTISANGQHLSMYSDDRNKSEVTISGTGGHFTMHAGDGKSTVDINASGNTDGNMPDFVTVYPRAKVVTLAVSGKQGGTLVMQTGASPETVLGFYKQKAEAAGFKQNLDANDAGNLMYAATFGGRAVQVLASKEGEGTRAQVTWSSH